MDEKNKSESDETMKSVIGQDLTGTGAPFLLLGLLWSAVSIALTAFGLVNGKRDEIVALIEKCGRCPDKIIGPESLYFSNLLPLSFGVCLIYGILSYAMWSIRSSSKVRTRVKRTTAVIVMLPLYCCLAFAFGAVFDAIIIFTHL
ncbi:hypothetical protein [Methylococcus sp. EFPC2]|uniref:hypothetical protein n=1 Tax=Methylococcus sp. EFPC2 TaxID=2812648 RepID=UPI001968965B|nr:hypothetical protein [Methylococcus sp. EFPC2]QSA97603.1 hypothetical protein JWZ97_01795 [Methylococcus sp. EFPC2]